MEVLEVIEQEDGGVELSLELTEEEREAYIRIGIKTTLLKYIEETIKEEKVND